MLQMRRTDLAPRFTRNTAILPRRTGAVADSLNHFRFTSSRHKRVPLHPTRRSAGRMHFWSLRSEKRNPFSCASRPGLLRRFAPRNDDTENPSRDASAPSFANHNHAICKKDSPLATKEGDEAPRGALSYQSPRLRPPASSKRFITLQGAIHLWVPARSGQAYWRARTEVFNFITEQMKRVGDSAFGDFAPESGKHLLPYNGLLAPYQTVQHLDNRVPSPEYKTSGTAMATLPRRGGGDISATLPRRTIFFLLRRSD